MKAKKLRASLPQIETELLVGRELIQNVNTVLFILGDADERILQTRNYYNVNSWKFIYRIIQVNIQSYPFDALQLIVTLKLGHLIHSTVTLPKAQQGENLLDKISGHTNHGDEYCHFANDFDQLNELDCCKGNNHFGNHEGKDFLE